MTISDLRHGENVEVDILKLIIEDVGNVIQLSVYNYTIKHTRDLVESGMLI